MLATLLPLVNRLGVTADQPTLRVLLQALKAADAACKRYCRRDLEAADYEEFFDAGAREYVLGQYPVTATTGTSADDPDFDYGVWVDADRLWGDSTLLTAGTDYRLQKSGSAGIVRRVACGATTRAWGFGPWGGWGCCGEDAVRVRYRAGYEDDEIPADLTEAVLLMASYEYLTRTSGGSSGVGAKKAEQWGVYRVQYATPSEMLTSGSTATQAPTEIMEVRSLLAPYRDWSVP